MAVKSEARADGGLSAETPAGQLLGRDAARVLREVAVPCLHYAHDQALWRYRLATWTNENSYGSDRYHCLASVLGAVLEERLPGCRVHRPEDAFGTPFAVQLSNALVYPLRYGRDGHDPHEGIRLPEDSWIAGRLGRGAHDGQECLDLPDLPGQAREPVVVLAWAGSRTRGLARAFLGVPHLDRHGLLGWSGPVEDLSLDVARTVADGAQDGLPRHSLAPQPDAFAGPQPRLVIEPRHDPIDLQGLFGDGRW